MITTVTLNYFINEFQKSETYKNKFSKFGLVALFYYIEEIEKKTDEQIELDIIALCCDFGEAAKEEYKKMYSNEEISKDNEYIITILKNGNILYREH